jgi:glutathione S-transferase
MSEFTLFIGSRNYSAWSLRAWIFMKRLGLNFHEVQFGSLSQELRDNGAHGGPFGRAPVLKHGELTVWDPLAICEYLADVSGRGWPAERAARALARCVCAEIHAGFVNIRTEWPLNARARNRRTPMTPGLEADVDRIDELWMECRRRFGAQRGGPWLFGEYTIADAMYAPEVLRFNTYCAPVSDTARWYIAAALEDDLLQQWVRAAQEDPSMDPDYEVG